LAEIGSNVLFILKIQIEMVYLWRLNIAFSIRMQGEFEIIF